nr:hypothetical protein [Rhodoferax sp.]
MTIQLTLINLIFLLATLIGGFWALVKVIISQYEKSLDTRFEALSGTIAKDQEITRQLERDFLTMKAELPLHYVRREDYIRGQSVLEAKLDGLALKLDIAQLRSVQSGKSHP